MGSAVLLDQNDDKKPYFSTGTLSGEIGYPFNMEANNRILYQKSILKSTNGSKYCIDGLLCVDTLRTKRSQFKDYSQPSLPRASGHQPA